MPPADLILPFALAALLLAIVACVVAVVAFLRLSSQARQIQSLLEHLKSIQTEKPQSEQATVLAKQVEEVLSGADDVFAPATKAASAPAAQEATVEQEQTPAEVVEDAESTDFRTDDELIEELETDVADANSVVDGPLVGPSLNLLAVGAARIDFDVNVKPSAIEPPMSRRIEAASVEPPVAEKLEAADVESLPEGLELIDESASTMDADPQEPAGASEPVAAQAPNPQQLVRPLSDHDEPAPIAAWMHELLEPASIAPSDTPLSDVPVITPSQEAPSEAGPPATPENLFALIAFGVCGVALTGGAAYWLSVRADFSDQLWYILAGVAGASVLLGRSFKFLDKLPYMAGTVVLVVLGAWQIQTVAVPPESFATVVASFALGFAACGYLGIFKSAFRGRLDNPYSPGNWAGLSVASSLCFMAMAYWALETPLLAPEPMAEFTLSWGGWGLVVAGAYVLATIPLFVLRNTRPQLNTAISTLLIGPWIMAATVAAIELEIQWVGLTWALMMIPAALGGRYLQVPALRLVAGALVLAVFTWLIVHAQGVIAFPLGQEPVLNWLLYGLGAPVLVLVVTACLYLNEARYLQRAGTNEHTGIANDFASSDAVGGGAGRTTLLGGNLRGDTACWRFVLNLVIVLLETGALVLLSAVVALQVRQYFHPQDLIELSIGLIETATFSVTMLTIGLILLLVTCVRRRHAYSIGADGFTLIALVVGAIVLGYLNNPLRMHEPVGDQRFGNWLLYFYGLPGLLAIIYASIGRANKRRVVPLVVLFAGLICILYFITLEVRQGFQGRFLDGMLDTAFPTELEWYIYSAAWAGFGLLLIAIGFALRDSVLQWSSLVVLIASALKFFIFDLRHLEDLYMALSYVGLAVTLLGLGFFYQRFVLRPGKTAAPKAPTDHKPADSVQDDQRATEQERVTV